MVIAAYELFTNMLIMYMGRPEWSREIHRELEDNDPYLNIRDTIRKNWFSQYEVID